MSLDVRKRTLREELRPRRARAAADAALRAGRLAASRIEATPEFARASWLALFASLPDELATRPLFDRSIAAGKRCAFPSCREKVLEFREVERWEDLVPGRYGVLEPAADGAPVALSRLDLVVVPGVAFDRKGNRLGRGGGYYDRTLAGLEADGPVLFGLGFEMQVVDEVPHGPLDRRMDAIVSEASIHRPDAPGR